MGQDSKAIESTKPKPEGAHQDKLPCLQNQVIYAEARMVGDKISYPDEATKPSDKQRKPLPPPPPSDLSLEWYKRGDWGVTIEKPKGGTRSD